MNMNSNSDKILNYLNNVYHVQLIKVENRVEQTQTAAQTANSLNKRVNSNIYVINLATDTIKRNYIIMLFKKYNINYTFVIVNALTAAEYAAINKLTSLDGMTIGETGCCLSHMWCLNHIVKHNINASIIFEDDVIFHKSFMTKFDTIFNNNINKTIDFALLGAHDFEFASHNHLNVLNNTYKPNETSNKLYGAHANYYSLLGAKRMLKIRVSQMSFFDKEYMLMFNHFKETSFVCCPNLVVANITTSALNHAHTMLSQIERMYYTSCFIDFKFTDYHFFYVNLLSLSIPITKEDTFTSHMNKQLFNHFKNHDTCKIIASRLSRLFTIDDIRQLM